MDALAVSAYGLCKVCAGQAVVDGVDLKLARGSFWPVGAEWGGHLLVPIAYGLAVIWLALGLLRRRLLI